MAATAKRLSELSLCSVITSQVLDKVCVAVERHNLSTHTHGEEVEHTTWLCGSEAMIFINHNSYDYDGQKKKTFLSLGIS